MPRHRKGRRHGRTGDGRLHKLGHRRGFQPGGVRAQLRGGGSCLRCGAARRVAGRQEDRRAPLCEKRNRRRRKGGGRPGCDGKRHGREDVRASRPPRTRLRRRDGDLRTRRDVGRPYDWRHEARVLRQARFARCADEGVFRRRLAHVRDAPHDVEVADEAQADGARLEPSQRA